MNYARMRAMMVVLLELLVNPDTCFEISNCLYEQTTIGELGSINSVVFDKVDSEKRTVRVRTMTHQLRFLDLASPHDVTAVVRELLDHAMRHENEGDRRFEVVIPLALQVKAHALLRHGCAASFKDMVSSSDALVRYHDGHQQLSARPELKDTTMPGKYESMWSVTAADPDAGIHVQFFDKSKQWDVDLHFNLLQAEGVDFGDGIEKVTVACGMMLGYREAVSQRQVLDLIHGARREMKERLRFAGKESQLYTMVVVSSPLPQPLTVADLPKGTIVLGHRAGT